MIRSLLFFVCASHLSPVPAMIAQTQQAQSPVKKNCSTGGQAIFHLRSAILEFHESAGGFPSRLDDLQKSGLDQTKTKSALEAASKAEQEGFDIRYEKTEPGWNLWVTSQNPSEAPCTSFFVDETGVIRSRPGPGDASANDKPHMTRGRVGGNVFSASWVIRPSPKAPDGVNAKASGRTVRLMVVVGTDGRVVETQVVKGDKRLAEVCIAAVKQWVARPTYFTGVPIEIVTILDFSFP